MKKILAVFLTFLFFSLIVIAVLFKLFGSSSDDTTATTPVEFPVVTTATGVTEQNPEEFVRSFYVWYLDNFSKDPLFPRSENRNEILSPWLTDTFLTSWDQILIESEINPVLLTAEDPLTWGNSITTRTSSQSIRTRIISVGIGSAPNTHLYNVEVEKTNDGGWKINSVLSGQ